MHKVRRASRDELAFLRGIANYQFRFNIGGLIFPEGVLLKISRNTGKIREVLRPDGSSIATVRASTYTFSLRLSTASQILKVLPPPKLRVVVVNEVSKDLLENRSTVFSRHVLSLDEGLRAGDEVIVTDEEDRLLCVGRLILSPYEVLHFIRGGAVKVRECVGDAGG